jgi:hypothetical protein
LQSHFIFDKIKATVKILLLFYAGMVELADTPDLGSGANSMQVQILLPAPSRPRN